MDSPCVLVVEDEKAALDVIRESLEDSGCGTLGASDGAEAIDVLESDPRTPCVILLDLMMPRMNGWQFREWQQQHPKFASVPVVLLSAVRDLKIESKKLGAAGYLEKPISFQTLVDTVKQHCGPCEREAG